MKLVIINQGTCWKESISTENKSRLVRKNLLFIDGWDAVPACMEELQLHHRDDGVPRSLEWSPAAVAAVCYDGGMLVHFLDQPIMIYYSLEILRKYQGTTGTVLFNSRFRATDFRAHAHVVCT